MWNADYNRNAMPFEQDNHDFGVVANPVSILHPRSDATFESTVINLSDRILPAADAFGTAAVNSESLIYLQECRTTFTAGFSAPIPGLMFTPDHAFVMDKNDSLNLISETFWHSRLFSNQHVRCDRSTDWRWRIDRNWDVSDVVKDEVYIMDHQFRFQYFHWFMDCLAKIWLLKNFMSRTPKIVVGGNIGKFQTESLAFYGIEIDECLRLPPNKIVKFERAIVPAFDFDEPLKTIRPNYQTGLWHTGWSVGFFSDLRSRALRHVGAPDEYRLKIFVSRSDAAHRKLINEAELVEFLSKEGFTIVSPGTLSFAEQVRLFAQARIIIGVHGAGLTNLIWAAPGCTVVELAPAGLRDVGYRFSSQLCGHRFATILCRALEHPRGLPYSDLEVDMGLVKRAFSELFLSANSGIPAELIGDLADDDSIVKQFFDAAQEAFAIGSLAKARSSALEYVRLRPSHYWGLFLLGKIHRALGDTAAMEQAFRDSIATADGDRIGAYFELALFQLGKQDFSEAALLDEALALAETSDQKRWYFAGLQVLKAFVALGAENLADAEGHLALAYGDDQGWREAEFLFDWVADCLRRAQQAGDDFAQSYPHLRRFMVATSPPEEAEYEAESGIVEGDAPEFVTPHSQTADGILA